MNNSEWCVIFAINDKVQNFPTTLPHGEATAGKKSFSARVEDVVMNIAEKKLIGIVKNLEKVFSILKS